MADPTKHQSLLQRKVWISTLALILVCSAIIYVIKIRENPAGFYVDESSIAYNAHVIAQTGKDEHGEGLPLFFRAFGEYKNPIYIYLLAAVFRLTGPSILVARLLSAFLIYAAALVTGLVALRISRRREIALIILAMALLTPWLFELSRVVLEVAIYPLLLAVFFLNLRRLSEKANWSWADAGSIAITLALLTYSYSIGRLFAPLLALGLLIFLLRFNWNSVARVWLLYGLLLLPLLVFHWRHPGALTERFHVISYSGPDSSYADLAWEFVKHYVGSYNPWRMVVRGDPNNRQVAAIFGVGQILAATFALAVFGLVVIWREHRRDPWWRFVVYALAVCAVPAALTKDYFHVLRLAPMPLLILFLCIPALEWLMTHSAKRAWRWALGAAFILALIQGALFQWQYHTYGRSLSRAQLFDSDYPVRIFSKALAQPSRPIYLADLEPIPGYIQALWYATLQNLPLTEFKRLAPDAPAPAGSIAITTEDIRPRCVELEQVEPYTVCRMEGEPQQQLPSSELRAELRATKVPSEAKADQKLTIRVAVKNRSDVVWLARERGASPRHLSAGNHWLDQSGREIDHDDGRAPLTKNLRPGEEVELEFAVKAPRGPGEYLLELDMLQEGVTWFGPHGSPTLRLPVKVK